VHLLFRLIPYILRGVAVPGHEIGVIVGFFEVEIGAGLHVALVESADAGDHVRGMPYVSFQLWILLFQQRDILLEIFSLLIQNLSWIPSVIKLNVGQFQLDRPRYIYCVALGQERRQTIMFEDFHPITKHSVDLGRLMCALEQGFKDTFLVENRCECCRQHKDRLLRY